MNSTATLTLSPTQVLDQDARLSSNPRLEPNRRLATARPVTTWPSSSVIPSMVTNPLPPISQGLAEHDATTAPRVPARFSHIRTADQARALPGIAGGAMTERQDFSHEVPYGIVVKEDAGAYQVGNLFGSTAKDLVVTPVRDPQVPDAIRLEGATVRELAERRIDAAAVYLSSDPAERDVALVRAKDLPALTDTLRRVGIKSDLAGQLQAYRETRNESARSGRWALHR